MPRFYCVSVIGDSGADQGAATLEMSCCQCSPAFARSRGPSATATVKAPVFTLPEAIRRDNGGRHTACVNTPARLTRTFPLFDPHDPGKAKPPKQPVKSGVTPTSFMHLPRGAEGTRTSETGSVSRFLHRGGCPGGEPWHRKSQEGPGAQVSANCPLFRILAQSPFSCPSGSHAGWWVHSVR